MFDSKVLNYNLYVTNDITSILVTPTLEDAKATYAINKAASLQMGSNKIEVVVTAENGETKTYTINVIRKEAGLAISTDSTLSTLQIKGENISFSPTKYLYNVTIFPGTEELKFYLEPSNEKAQQFQDYFYVLPNTKRYNQIHLDYLHWATRRNNLEIVELLLKSGAKIDKKNNISETALIYAVDDNNYEMVKFLLNNGADANIKNKYNDNSLIIAIKNNNYEIVELLLYAGVSIDSETDNGDTALIIASSNNNREIVELLLDYHADEFILNKKNESFYDLLNFKNKQYFLKEFHYP
jgi:hypothetical protein